jgi:uncharacterized protein (TIGR03083 family)
MPATTAWISAIRSSQDRFAALLRPLEAAQREAPSYDSEWSIAQVASHLGSQSEIFLLFLDAGLTGQPSPGGEVFGPIWDRWNALGPSSQVDESIEANEVFVRRLEQLSETERQAFTLSLFGVEQDITGLMTMRLGEHAVHTWDIAVALNGQATLAADAVELMIDSVYQPAARSGKAAVGVAPIAVETSSPERHFVVSVDPAVELTRQDEASENALRLPAEAFIRLVYGRLDPAHAPAEIAEDRQLEQLRAVFPGF